MAPTPDDIRILLPEGSTVTDETLAGLIALAERRLKLTVGTAAWAAVQADPDRAALADDMIAEAVARLVRNPATLHGYESETEGNYSYRLSSGSAADIWFPGKDLDLLTGRRRRRVATAQIRLGARRL